MVPSFIARGLVNQWERDLSIALRCKRDTSISLLSLVVIHVYFTATIVILQK